MNEDEPGNEPGTEPADVTRMLRDGARGEELFPLVYDELRALAGRRMGAERTEHTLQATALVNEAYLRLVRDRDMQWRDRRHFFGAAAEAMRRVLVDHARRVKSDKRGGGQERLAITLGGLAREDDPDLLLALDEALSRLEREDARVAEVARLRFFTGLSGEDVSKALELSPRTVARDWAFARARLTELLTGDD
jgi:RNA polymerase sigma factor (TIGR02999 family)